jgi:hypothetical protein
MLGGSTLCRGSPKPNLKRKGLPSPVGELLFNAALPVCVRGLPSPVEELHE